MCALLSWLNHFTHDLRAFLAFCPRGTPDRFPPVLELLNGGTGHRTGIHLGKTLFNFLLEFF